SPPSTTSPLKERPGRESRRRCPTSSGSGSGSGCPFSTTWSGSTSSTRGRPRPEATPWARVVALGEPTPARDDGAGTPSASARLDILSREEVVLVDGGQGERLVADVVEQHGQPVLLDRHHDTVPPLGVSHRAARRELVVAGWLLLGSAGLAGVAVAAYVGQLLAEVAEQKLPPASGGLGVAAHHFDPGPDQTLVGLRDVRCLSHCLLYRA